MTRRPAMEGVVLALNTAGLLAYLFWLVFRSRRIMYAQDGVLYLLPCVAFFFVFAYLLRRRPGSSETPAGSGGQDERED